MLVSTKGDALDRKRATYREVLLPLATYGKALEPQWSLSVTSLCNTCFIDGNLWQEEEASQKFLSVFQTCYIPHMRFRYIIFENQQLL